MKYEHEPKYKNHSKPQNEIADDLLNSDIALEEMTASLKSMQNSKSGGPDAFVNEILKINSQEIIPILRLIFNNILNSKEIPWNISWMVPLYKNGDKNELSSYRCINLSSCIEKLLTKIIKTRLTKFSDKYNIISPLQSGFRKENSVIDNIYILKEIIAVYKNKKQPLYLCFIDLSKAFDSIPIDRLKMKLRKTLPECKLLSLIIALLDNKQYEVLYDGDRTQSFRLNNGIPQGDSMSPILFNLYINDLLDCFDESVQNNDPVILEDVKLSILIYADDILLMSQSKEGVIKQIKEVQNYCDNNGLKINFNKTKIMIRNEKLKYSNLKLSTKAGTNIIDVVEDYKYLGMWISKSNKKTYRRFGKERYKIILHHCKDVKRIRKHQWLPP